MAICRAKVAICTAGEYERRTDREQMTDPYEPPEPTLGTYLAVLRRRKWWVIAVTELQLVTSAPIKAAVGRKLGSVPSVSAAEVGQTNVIAVTATAANPARAALIANAYANAFVTYQRSAAIDNLTAADRW